MEKVVLGIRIFLLLLIAIIIVPIGLHFVGVYVTAPAIDEPTVFRFYVSSYSSGCYPCETVEDQENDLLWGQNVTFNTEFVLTLYEGLDWKDDSVTNRLDSQYEKVFNISIINGDEETTLSRPNPLISIVGFLEDPDRLLQFSDEVDKAWTSGPELESTASIETGVTVGVHVVEDAFVSLTWTYDEETGIMNSFDFEGDGILFSIYRSTPVGLGVHDLYEGFFMFPIVIWLIFEASVFVIKWIRKRGSKEVEMETS